MVLGLDPRMLAGHKRYAPIAAALRCRPAGAPQRGKDREPGWGKARLQGDRRERSADWTRRPIAAALFEDSSADR